MNNQEATVRMTKIIAQIVEQHQPFTGGDSIAVLENLVENPYGVTPNEDVARLVLTMAQAIALAADTVDQMRAALAADNADPFRTGVFLPVKKGKPS
jgi:hypothetical protein